MSFVRFNCIICLDWLDDSKNIACPPCGHNFHEECIEKLLHDDNGNVQECATCPCCRSGFTKAELRRNFFSTAVFGATTPIEELQNARSAIELLEKSLTAMRAKVELLESASFEGEAEEDPEEVLLEEGEVEQEVAVQASSSESSSIPSSWETPRSRRSRHPRARRLATTVLFC
ncbi:hypothetical protein QR680_006396 [Steinernema hermaphroditum]|uniref:RING-type domain-containing protein n=1 Tax=Steinernema hermaphroditum TaxID=289476 RepID=A0AA39HXS3_9BILA|nr:hypothetical protein QR680_006396 [Steinernema hermaphroditum]